MKEERRHLQQFLRMFSFAASFFGTVELVSGFILKEGALALVGLSSYAVLVTAAFAGRMAKRREPGSASLLLGYAILLVACVNSPFFTIISPTLAILPFIAIALVLPHVQGRALTVFLIATLTAEMAVSAFWILFPDRPAVPPLFVVLLSVSSMAAVANLILLLLLQFRSRVRRSLQQSEEAVRARDEFISIASHELLTPLTPLSLHTSALMYAQQHGPLSPVDSLSGKIEGVDRQIHRLSRLVNELLDISRISLHRMRLDLTRVDLGEMTREVVLGYGAELERTGCPVSLAVDPRGVQGDWDGPRLEQVLWNLLSNAAKFGEGKPIEISVFASNGIAEVKVRDHGIGISPEDQYRIFEQFERAVSAKGYGGFGLGLWISRVIVESMGGSIWVESKPGDGSTFGLRLPQSQVAAGNRLRTEVNPSLST